MIVFVVRCSGMAKERTTLNNSRNVGITPMVGSVKRKALRCKVGTHSKEGGSLRPPIRAAY